MSRASFAFRAFMAMVVPCVWLLAFAAAAAPIPIQNFGFESPVQSPGGFNVMTDWQVTGFGFFPVTAFRPTAASFASIPEGLQVAAIGNSGAAGSMNQTLGATLQANTTYTLQVDIGRRLDFQAYNGYQIELAAGGTLLACWGANWGEPSCTNTFVTPNPGQFLTETFVFTTGATHPLLGQPLQISIGVLVAGGQTDFDNVRLDAQSTGGASGVPEPSAWTLAVSGLALCGLRRSRSLRAKTEAPFRSCMALWSRLTVGAVVASLISFASAATLNGTIRDFCAPGIAGSCTQMSDFEGAITGIVTGMVSSTLNGVGLPDYTGGGIGATDATNFSRWYANAPGFNLSAPFSIALNETSPGSGVFTYANSAFFPIDGQLFGNQGRSNNYHFTLHLQGLTNFLPGDSFTFTGDDDLWIYIGGRLAIDLGGVHATASRTITGADLVLLGLSSGVDYPIDIFFAERHTASSRFDITTSFRLTGPAADPVGIPEPATGMLLASGVGALLWLRARTAR